MHVYKFVEEYINMRKQIYCHAYKLLTIGNHTNLSVIDQLHAGLNVTQFTKTRHNGAFLEIQIFQPSARLVHTWFLRIASVYECLYVCMCVCVCVRPRGY